MKPVTGGRRDKPRNTLSAPSDVRRYFISHQEAGELCVLSCGLGENRDVFFPNLAQGLDEKTFADIARDLLVELGYQPVECASEAEAKAQSAKWQAESAESQAEGAERRAESGERGAEGAKRQAQSGERFALRASRLAQGWPCYFFKSDTTGEKEFEEFFAQDERLVLDRFKRVGIVKGTEDGGRKAEDGGRGAEDGGLEVAIHAFLNFVREAKTDPTITKADYVREIQKLVPTLQHHETGKNLDQRCERGGKREARSGRREAGSGRREARSGRRYAPSS